MFGTVAWLGYVTRTVKVIVQVPLTGKMLVPMSNLVLDVPSFVTVGADAIASVGAPVLNVRSNFSLI